MHPGVSATSDGTTYRCGGANRRNGDHAGRVLDHGHADRAGLGEDVAADTWYKESFIRARNVDPSIQIVQLDRELGECSCRYDDVGHGCCRAYAYENASDIRLSAICALQGYDQYCECDYEVRYGVPGGPWTEWYNVEGEGEIECSNRFSRWSDPSPDQAKVCECRRKPPPEFAGQCADSGTEAASVWHVAKTNNCSRPDISPHPHILGDGVDIDAMCYACFCSL